MARRSEIVDLMEEKYGVEPEQVSPEATMQDLGLDSLSVAELVFDIEDLYGIEIEAEDAQFATFGQAMEVVARYVDFDD